MNFSMKYKVNKCFKFYVKILITTSSSFMNQPLDLENTCNYCFERSLNDKKIFSFKTKLVIMHLEKDLIESEKMIV